MDPVRKLTSLPRRRGSDHGWGAPLLAAGLLLQAAVLVGFAEPEVSVDDLPPVSFGAAVVIEPGDGTEPGELGSRASWPADSRLQITFRPGQEAWTAVLWFDGPDTVVPLYPRMAAGEWGTTRAGLYVLPSDGAYLRLTRTSAEGDLLAIIDSREPDPEVVDVLMNPRPGAVRALRERLTREGASRNRSASSGATERFLPTADGRAVAVPWREQYGTGSVVMTWEVHVE
ncbi:MAG: hypothetical protein GY898_01785 [Proteobacteria bacterium]|nr:hypothetical protein [Pseudomonadota bacterium]